MLTDDTTPSAPTSDAPASSPDAASEGGGSPVRVCPCGAPATKPATTRGAGLCDDCQFDRTFGGE
jgi:hypothetical protein